MTIKDLKIKRMKTKNLLEKNAYMMLIDFAQKAAKEKNDNDVDKYLPQAVKKFQKMLAEVVNPIEDEVKVVNEVAEKVLPKTLDEVKTKEIIEDILKGCDTIDKKCFGVVMSNLKIRNDIDMKIASKILKEIL